MRIKQLGVVLATGDKEVILKELSKPDFDKLRTAVGDHGVIVVLDHSLKPSKQISLPKRSGKPQYHINDKYQFSGDPEIIVLTSELDKDGNHIGFLMLVARGIPIIHTLMYLPRGRYCNL